LADYGVNRYQEGGGGEGRTDSLSGE
jgi:hypothetical protein